MDPSSENRAQDRLTTQLALEAIEALGRPMIAGSNLAIEGASIGPQEVEIMRNLVNSTFAYEGGTRTLAHLTLAGKFARKFGDALKITGSPAYTGLNSDLLEIAALGHDLGRSVTHRALRHDIAGDMLLKRMGMRSDIIAAMPSALSHTKITRRFLQEFQSQNPNASPEELQEALKGLAQQTLNNSSIEERIVLISDICGKPGDELKGILTFEGVMEHHHTSRKDYKKASGLNPIFPSDERIDLNVRNFTGHLYRLHKDWLASEGVDVEQVRQELLEESEHHQQSINQSS